MIIINTLQSLLAALKLTASNHKKKLIAIAILLMAYKIVRKFIKIDRVLSFLMFFFRLWDQVLQCLPLPTTPAFRFTSAFQFMEPKPVPELCNAVDIKALLLKVKNKQESSLINLKQSILSSTMLSLILYPIPSIYNLTYRKYYNDFVELGAATQFTNAIDMLKKQFVSNLQVFRAFLQNQFRILIEDWGIADLVGLKCLEDGFAKLVAHMFRDTVHVGDKVLIRKTQLNFIQDYRIADNCFKTTKEYIAPKPPSKISQFFSMLALPITLPLSALSGLSSLLLPKPTQQLTPYRFSCNQFLYILPLKRTKVHPKWPNLSSEHLWQLILQELVTFFYSISFNVVVHAYAQYQLQVFMNRLHIYFEKRVTATTGKKQKKLLDLLPVFYKIVQEEVIMEKGKSEFYERQLLAAFRDTRYRLSHQSTPLHEYQFRNRILLQIYNKNKLQHTEKDMQAKFYNDREGLLVEVADVAGKTGTEYEEKDEIEQLMQIYGKADEQKQTTGAQLQMMRELAQS